MARRAGRFYGRLPPLGRAAITFGASVFLGAIAILFVSRFADSPLWFFVAAAAAYLLPSMIAAGRDIPNKNSVFVVNLFLGWTVIGWVVALAMAVGRITPSSTPQPDIRSAGPVAAPTDVRQCPFCAEDIKKAAIVCKHCGRDVAPAR